MLVPMASRFRTYSVALAPDAQDYCDAVLAHPLVMERIEGAQTREIGWETCAAYP